MDKIVTPQEFLFRHDSNDLRGVTKIVVSNNVVIECYYYDGKKSITSINGDDDFYTVMEIAMQRMVKGNPKMFRRMFYGLKLSERDYSIAEKVRKEELHRLKQIQNILDF